MVLCSHDLPVKLRILERTTWAEMPRVPPWLVGASILFVDGHSGVGLRVIIGLLLLLKPQ